MFSFPYFSLQFGSGPCGCRPERSELWLCIPRIPWLSDAPESSVGDRCARYQTLHGLWFRHHSLFQVFLLAPSSTCSRICSLVWNDCRKKRKNTLNKRRRWFHSPWVKLPLVKKSACWFLVSIFNLDFGVQVDYVKQPIERNSVDSGHMSHRRTSAFDDHLDQLFIVFKQLQLGF